MSSKTAPRTLVVPEGGITEPVHCEGCGQGYILEQFAVECLEDHERKGDKLPWR